MERFDINKELKNLEGCLSELNALHWMTYAVH